MSGYDARLELWEELCTCGGARKSPDVRMCSCLAPYDAGLDCTGCNRGVLLIKDGRGGRLFWGCSNYKKGGCKFTKPYGKPHDEAAARQLNKLRGKKERAKRKEREEFQEIVDPHERQWRADCRCDGARDLNTYDCFMRSEGGCGFLPSCPRCDGDLFLQDGSYGKYWQCRNKEDCAFQKSYLPHQNKSKIASALPTSRQDLSSSGSATATPKKSPQSVSLTPEQKIMVEKNRLAALERRKKYLQSSATKPSVKTISLTPEQKATIEEHRLAALERLKKHEATTAANKEGPSTLSSAASRTTSGLPPLPGKNLSVPRISLQDEMSLTAKENQDQCRNSSNQKLIAAFRELEQLYRHERNIQAANTYGRVAHSIQQLEFQVTKDNAKSLGKGKTKVANIGVASADKAYEFVTTGSMAKLDEKRAASKIADV